MGYKYVGSGRIIRGIKDYCKRNGILIKDRFIVELLEECNTPEQLNDREIYWISFYNSTSPDVGYNRHPGGLNTLLDDNGMFAKKQSEHANMKNREWHENRIWVTNGIDSVFIEPCDIGVYENIGYRRGRVIPSSVGKKRSQETSKKISNALRGKKKTKEHKDNLSKNRTNRVWITDGTQTKAVNPESLQLYLCNGWRRGRTLKNQRTHSKN